MDKRITVGAWACPARFLNDGYFWARRASPLLYYIYVLTLRVVYVYGWADRPVCLFYDFSYK
jgi:hypothetical protein